MSSRAGDDIETSSRRRGQFALLILVFARVSVSFQFQSIAPLSILLDDYFPIGLSRLGLLLGVYMAPGIVVALILPGLIASIGRTRTISAAFLLMAAGETMVWTAAEFETALAGRLMAGAGGCVIYIVTINLVADLDTSVARHTRMGLIAAAWPLGNALALGALGWGVHAHARLGSHAPLAFVIVSLGAIFLLLVRSRDASAEVGPTPSFTRWRAVLRRIWPVALAFALYNISFIILTGFAARILMEDGVDPAVASGIASIPMWMFLVSVPLGGFIAGRSLKGDLRIVMISCVAAAIAVLASAGGFAQALFYVVAGLIGGLPTAPLLARGRDMSGDGTDITYSALFFVFFAVLIVLPALAGRAADAFGTGHTILWIAAALLAMSAILFASVVGRLGRA